MATSLTALDYRKSQFSAGETWHVGYDSILFFTIAVMFNGLLLFQYFQDPTLNQDLIFIGIFQILTALGGFMIGMLVTRNNNELDVSMSDKKRISETYVNGIIFSGVVIMLDAMLNNVLGNQSMYAIESSLLTTGEITIPLTASVVEEAFFSLGLSIFLYKAFTGMFGKHGVGEMVAIIAGSLFVAAFFAMIHMWVYKTHISLLIILAINRFAYNVAFLKYKNFSMVVIMHMFHNGLSLLLAG